MKRLIIMAIATLCLSLPVNADDGQRSEESIADSPLATCFKDEEGKVHCWLAHNDVPDSDCSGNCPIAAWKKLEDAHQQLDSDTILCDAKGKCTAAQIFRIDDDAFEGIKITGKQAPNCGVSTQGQSSCSSEKADALSTDSQHGHCSEKNIPCQVSRVGGIDQPKHCDSSDKAKEPIESTVEKLEKR